MPVAEQNFDLHRISHPYPQNELVWKFPMSTMQQPNTLFLSFILIDTDSKRVDKQNGTENSENAVSNHHFFLSREFPNRLILGVGVGNSM